MVITTTITTTMMRARLKNMALAHMSIIVARLWICHDSMSLWLVIGPRV